jgi:hypothetical protein
MLLMTKRAHANAEEKARLAAKARAAAIKQEPPRPAKEVTSS